MDSPDTIYASLLVLTCSYIGLNIFSFVGNSLGLVTGIINQRKLEQKFDNTEDLGGRIIGVTTLPGRRIAYKLFGDGYKINSGKNR